MATLVRQTALVVGVANSRSLAWKSALSLLQKKYNVVVAYQNDRFEASVNKMVQSYCDEHKEIQDDKDAPKLACVPCDVSSDEEMENLFSTHLPRVFHEELQIETVNLDALVHSIAYADANAMKPAKNSQLSLLKTSRKSFETAHDISSYSLLGLVNHALPFLAPKTSSVTALTYLGSTRAIPNYNIMGPAKASLEAVVRGLANELGPDPYGIRVNAVSAGPVSTIASRGIQHFSDMKQIVEDKSPLRRNVTGNEVGDVVAYLAGTENGASAITGQVIFVDAGFSIV